MSDKTREEFEKWWNDIVKDGEWTTLERLAAHDAWQEQQKKIEQLEEYREELIQMFKNLIEEKKYTTYCAYADNGWSHEESTRKAREEVKAELELLQKVRKVR